MQSRDPSPEPSLIRDRHGRTFDYLRVAVTERCNLRCVYCMPEEGVDFAGGERLLSAGEILRLVRVAAGLGVSKVRLTGGEPLVRKDILEIVAGAAATPGVESVHLTTNGLLLHRHAGALMDAGLTGLNISLDTLDEARFRRIARRPGAARVLAAIRLACQMGFPSVKVNVVAMRGVNDDEIPAFAALTRDLPVTVRFIELMPFDERQIWRTGRFLSVDRIRAALAAAFPDLAAAEGSATETGVMRIAGHRGRVALIPAYTRSICATCNRIRLTADGRIRSCLYSDAETDLMGPLRAGASDAELGALLTGAMRDKPADGWEAQRLAATRERTSMTQIGG